MNTINARTLFGSYIRSRRINLGLTLRDFCVKYNIDPGNLSRMERGLLPPSIDEEKIAQLGRNLELIEGSVEWTEFLDLAYQAKGKIPEQILESEEALSFLPAFYRSVSGEKLTKNKLNKLIKILTEEDSESS